MGRLPARTLIGLACAAVVLVGALLVSRDGAPSPREVRAVEQAVRHHLDADMALARGTKVPRDAQARVRAIYVPARVRAEVAWLRKTMRIQAAHPEFVFDDEHVVVDRWTDIDVDDGRARVVAEGRERYHLVRAARWKSNPSRWRLDLVRHSGVWKLERLRWEPLDGS